MEKKPFTPRPPRPNNNGPRRPFVPNKEKDPYATNEHIRAREVRLVADNVVTDKT